MRKGIYVLVALLSMFFIGNVSAAQMSPDEVSLTTDIHESLQNIIGYLIHNGSEYIKSECVEKEGVYYTKTAKITDNESRECALRQTELYGEIKEWDQYIVNNINALNYNENDTLINLYIEGTGNAIASLGSLNKDEIERMNLRDEINKKLSSTTIDKNDLGEKVTTCEGLMGPNVMSFIKLLRNIIMIAGPIVAIVLGTYEMMMAVAKGEDEDKKKAMKRFKNRLVASALLIIVPILVPMIIGIVNPAYAGCI